MNWREKEKEANKEKGGRWKKKERGGKKMENKDLRKGS